MLSFKKVVLGILRDKKEGQGFINHKELVRLFRRKNWYSRNNTVYNNWELKLRSRICKANINSEKEVVSDGEKSSVNQRGY